MNTKQIGIGLVALLAASAGAAADSTLHFDMNSTTATAGGGPFGEDFTGTVTITDDANSLLADVALNGVSAGVSTSDFNLNITVQLVGGVVSGGAFSLVVSDNTYIGAVIAGSGSVYQAANGSFEIDGLTYFGDFTGGPGGTSDTFLGVDIAPFVSHGPLAGSLLQLQFNPAGPDQIDPDADVDMYVSVPVPQAAGLALAGMGAMAGFGLVRRRSVK